MGNGPLRISLTEFVDYVVGAGAEKLTKVLRAFERRQGGYSPVTDFYRPLREGIVRYHKGRMELDELASRLRRLGSALQQQHLPDALRRYQGFLKKHDVCWLGEPPREHWVCGDLEVTVNPELYVAVDGLPSFLKLYFKQDPLNRHRLATIFELMGSCFDEPCGVLDVRRGKVYLGHAAERSYKPLLLGEACSFAKVYEEIAF